MMFEEVLPAMRDEGRICRHVDTLFRFHDGELQALYPCSEDEPLADWFSTYLQDEGYFSDRWVFEDKEGR